MKLKKIICMCVFIGIVIILSGCNINNNKENESLVSSAQQNSEYSDEIQKVLNIKVEELGNKSMGELIDKALKDYEWTESDLYETKKCKGAISVRGTDKKNGDDIIVIWGKQMTDPNETNHFIVMHTGIHTGMEQIIEYDLFINYLKQYTE